MASTRNNNTIGNYKCEEATYKKNLERNLSLNSSYAPPNKPAIPYGGSAPPSFMYGSSLSNNSVDIESALFGINSTNLVEPMKPVTPSIKKLNNILNHYLKNHSTDLTNYKSFLEIGFKFY